MRLPAFLLALLAASLSLAAVRNCACDAAKPETLEQRQCSLYKAVEQQPGDTPVLFLKDINPTKPNRWLAMPRAHYVSLADMKSADRAALWTAAIDKAKALWGDDWGLAYNGDESRTQCHAHLHIGKLVNGEETPNVVTADAPADIPAPKDGTGLWVHPSNGKLHVHTGEQTTEFVLMR